MSKGRILFADDDEIFGGYLSERLRREGYSCLWVKTGAAALAAVREEAFDVLVSDIFMPGNVSLELIQELSRLRCGLPVILLTGRPTVETAIKSVGCAVMGYLTKPPEWSELKPLIELGIVRGRFFRDVQAAQKQLDHWMNDLCRIEGTMGGASVSADQEAAAQYLRLMAANLKSVVSNMEESMHLLPRGTSEMTFGRERQLITALEEAVEVLLQTKQNFKCKRLSDLRRSLSDVLSDTCTGD